MGKRTIVVAYSMNGVIGNDNSLLWKQSSDLKRFKEITQGGIVVMGRKTFDSIGKPLPSRRNIIISNNKDLIVPPASGEYEVECMNLDQVKNIDGDIFIIGGGQIYKEFINESDEILSTLVHEEFIGDTTFPEIGSHWMLVDASYHKADDKNEFGYSFLKYINRRK